MSLPGEVSATLPTTTERQIVTFRVGTQWCGVPVSDVQEVLVAPRVTPVPLTPDDVLGVVNLRGQIVTVIDLAYPLGMSLATAGTQADMSVVLPAMDVVVREQDELYALRVDEVGDVITVPSDAVESVPPLFDPRWAPLAIGLLHRADDVVMILNAGRLTGGMASSSH